MSLNAKRVWLKGLRKSQMPVTGPDTNLFIVSLSRVRSSLLGSPLRIRPWVSWDSISQRTTGMADGKDLLGHPVHMPRQDQDEIVSLLRSQVPRLDLNNSSSKTGIARKFRCLLVLLQNRLFKALDVLLLVFPELHHKRDKWKYQMWLWATQSIRWLKNRIRALIMMKWVLCRLATGQS